MFPLRSHYFAHWVSAGFCFSCWESCYLVQAGLELTTLLPRPPKCWDYRCIPYTAPAFCKMPVSPYFPRQQMEIVPWWTLSSGLPSRLTSSLAFQTCPEIFVFGRGGQPVNISSEASGLWCGKWGSSPALGMDTLRLMELFEVVTVQSQICGPTILMVRLLNLWTLFIW